MYKNTEPLYYTPETNIVNQLYINKNCFINKKKYMYTSFSKNEESDATQHTMVNKRG